MSETSNQIEELKKRVANLKFEDYAELDAIRRRFRLFVKHVFGEDSEYFDELEELDFPEPTSEPMSFLEDYVKPRKQRWKLSTDKMTNLLDTINDDLKMTENKKASKAKETKPAMIPKSNRVFVVHGKDEGMKEAVARTLEKLSLKPIILHEQPNEGRTIIEKFSDYSDVGFAVVLLSADDFGCLRIEGTQKGKFRARQNVIFELGFFIGKLGRKNVMPIFKEEENFDMLSDYKGVAYTPFDNGGQWKFKIVKELQACHYKVDANKIL